jgi:transposase
MQINKSDRNDAVGIARIMQCGWYKEVRVKDLDSHAVKALLVSRARSLRSSGISRIKFVDS